MSTEFLLMAAPEVLWRLARDGHYKNYHIGISMVNAASITILGGGGVDDIEPLEPALWFGAIRTLARKSKKAGDDELERLLRHAYHLLQLTPRPLRCAIRPSVSETQFEQLLDCKAYESAASTLAAPPMSYAVSKLEADLFEARVCLPGQPERTTLRSADFSSALLGAWLQYLISLEERSLTLQNEVPHPAPHKVQSGRHLRLIEH